MDLNGPLQHLTDKSKPFDIFNLAEDLFIMRQNARRYARLRAIISDQLSTKASEAIHALSKKHGGPESVPKAKTKAEAEAQAQAQAAGLDVAFSQGEILEIFKTIQDEIEIPGERAEQKKREEAITKIFKAAQDVSEGKIDPDSDKDILEVSSAMQDIGPAGMNWLNKLSRKDPHDPSDGGAALDREGT